MVPFHLNHTSRHSERSPRLCPRTHRLGLQRQLGPDDYMYRFYWQEVFGSDFGR